MTRRLRAFPARARRRPLRGVLGAAASIALALACAGDRPPPGEPELSREGLPPDVTASVAVVDGLHDTVIGILKQGPELGYEGRFAALAAVVQVSFDLPVMARASYGRGYVDLSEAQRKTWLEVFARFQVSSFADVRDHYQGETYRLLGFKRPAPGIVVLESKLDYPGRNVDIYTDYRLRNTRRGWRIVDIHRPPSVSEVAMRRAEYRTVLERHGFDGLIEEMEARIRRRRQP